MKNLIKLSTFAFLSMFICNPVMGQKFKVTYSSASQKTFSGNIFLYLSKSNKNPKDERLVGLKSFPCYRITVKNIKPGVTAIFDDDAVSYPVSLSNIERGVYYAQVVWDNNLGGRQICNSPGNIYNKSIKVNFTLNRNQIFYITCNEVVPEQDFTETEYCKEIKVPSKSLTAFHDKPVDICAAVLLPEEYYNQPQRKFPVVYYILGYGADYHIFPNLLSVSPAHYHFFFDDKQASLPIDTTACIRVILDGNCPLGHSVYANSENNGPWGDALVEEFIPEIENKYRCNFARLVSGHSSGGWASLWLQIQYPKVFTACWSSSPDPVDFRNFTGINLYEDKNMFYKNDSTLRMCGAVEGYFPWYTYKMSYQMEYVISRGEQNQSFNAVFSQRNNDGQPRELCNPITGEIDSITLEHWKNYDISLYLKTNWKQLEPNLKGKILISVGEQDEWFLNDAVHLLDYEMKRLDTGFEFTYYHGGHFIYILSDEYKINGNKFLEKKYNDFINNL